MAKSTTDPAPAPDLGQDEVDAMFGEGAEQVSDEDFDDLLDQVIEDDSEGWVPEKPGEGIAGRVIKVGVTRSDFAKDGEDPNVPTVTIQTADGTKLRVIGYSAVLKRELSDANPEVGDRIAVKFFGEKKLKTGKFAGRPFKHFGVIVRKPQAAR